MKPIDGITAVCFFLLLSCGVVKAQDNPQYLVGTTTTLIDGTQSPYDQVIPGDTVFIQSGTRENLLIRNFQGSAGSPVVFMNYGGAVVINTSYGYGIAIRGCRYVRFTGSGDKSHFYGFNFRHANGAGLSLDAMTSDCEVDHVSIEGVPIAGLYAKTDPDCSYLNTRDKFTQYNTLIHDNYIDSVGNEGLYIGSTKYSGVLVNCNGKDTLLYPSLLSGVRVYNNVIRYSGWDGIQVSSAASDCQVYDNLVMYDSQGETDSQMSGIILGGGSKCDCYNNSISEGKGDGIELHGLGGSRIFNNIIVDAGRSYFPNDPQKKKYGIYVTDISVQMDSSFYILFNDIVNPKTEGIRFNSVNSRNNLIVSNAILNPGDAGAYVVTSTNSNVLISHNYFAPDSSGAGFIAGGYDLLPGSSLIDRGYDDNRNVSFDFLGRIRPSGTGFDIGAFEYQHFPAGLINPAGSAPFSPKVYPNPVREMLTLEYETETAADVFISIYNLNGKLFFQDPEYSVPPGSHTFSFDVRFLPSGVYLYTLQTGKHAVSGRFIKLD
jgi:parallel beta-helix repeat protein